MSEKKKTGQKKTKKSKPSQKSKSTSGIDWDAIAHEYIHSPTKITHKQLAAKFGVTYSAVRSHAYKEKWSDQRREFQQKVSTHSRTVVDENLAIQRANQFARARDCGIDALLGAFAQIAVLFDNPDTFYRYNKAIAERDMDGNIVSYFNQTLIGGEFDSVGFAQVVRSLDVLFGRLDALEGILSPNDSARIAVLKDKFELDKKKAGFDNDNEGGGVIVIPEQVMPIPPKEFETMTPDDFLDAIEQATETVRGADVELSED